jgi:hypothetical protein
MSGAAATVTTVFDSQPAALSWSRRTSKVNQPINPTTSNMTSTRVDDRLRRCPSG